jgi:hypothetical protein
VLGVFDGYRRLSSAIDGATNNDKAGDQQESANAHDCLFS